MLLLITVNYAGGTRNTMAMLTNKNKNKNKKNTLKNNRTTLKKTKSLTLRKKMNTLANNRINIMNDEPYSELQCEIIHDELMVSEASNVINILYRYYLYKLENKGEIVINLLCTQLENKEHIFTIQKLLDTKKYDELNRYLDEKKKEYRSTLFTNVPEPVEILNTIGLSIIAEYYFTFTDDEERYSFMFDLYNNIPKTVDEVKEFAEKILKTEFGSNPFSLEDTSVVKILNNSKD